MKGKLQKEIQQTRPFTSLEEEALLNIQRTSDALDRLISGLLKPHRLTARQYNVMRILRGAGEEGASCKEIGARMISADPDVTRLVDRLETRGLASRGRADSDRRLVSVHVTPEGLELLQSLDAQVNKLVVQAMKGLGKTELRTLIELLERVRSAHS